MLSRSLCTLVAVCFFLGSLCASASTASPSAQFSVDTWKWTEELAGKLKILVQGSLPVNQLQESYRESSFETIDSENLIENAVQSIGDQLNRQVKALEEIAIRSATSASDHLNDISFHEDRMSAARIKYAVSADHFHEIIDSASVTSGGSSNTSAVHIPFDVYEGWMWHRYKTVWWEDMDLMNALEWSSKLDETFKKNFKENQQIYRQFFASSRGFLRYYPGHKWETVNNHPSIYDPRRAHWFTQTMSSAKDLLILIDMSGSIHGPSFDILKITVRSLLSSLGEKDYFNVAQFGGNISWLVPCFQRFVPATSRNKQLVHQAVDSLHPHGKASYGQALKFAYDQLIRSESERWQTSGCQQAVILISDGGTELPEEQLKRFAQNPSTRDVRIFTLAVSPHPIPTVSLRKIACQTKAYHSAIITVGAIRSKVLDYLKVLSRPLALSQDHQLTQWSLVYRDIGGFGDVISISMPVYNMSSPNSSAPSQTLLGVAGIDIPLSVFDTALPDSILGLGGYKMMTSDSGTLLLHPDLRKHKSYLEDPLIIDIDDIENIDYPQNLRKSLIDRKRGKIDYNVSVVLNEKYVISLNKTVHFAPVPHSPYSLAVSIWNGSKRLVPSQRLLEKLKVANLSLADIVPGTFCEMNATDFMERVRRGTTTCDQATLLTVLFDILKTGNLEWKKKKVLSSRFIVTRSGVLRMEARNQRLVDDLSHVGTSSIFNRLALRSASLLVSPFHDHHGRVEFVIATKIAVQDQPVAVVGGLADEETVNHLWEEMAVLNNCSMDSMFWCYWIDDGGYIVYTNRIREMIGSFLGSQSADPEVMRILLNGSDPLYRHVNRVKPSSSCRLNTHEQNTTNSGVSVVASLVKNLVTVVSQVQSLVFAAAFATLAWSQPARGSSNSVMDITLDQLRQPKVDSYVCSKIYNLYEKIDTSDGNSMKKAIFSCPSSKCQRRISAKTIPGTNTVFVISEKSCGCSMDPLPHGLTEKDEFQTCDTTPRYRKSLEKCYAVDPREDPKPCSSSSVTFMPSSYAILTNSVFILVRFLKRCM